MQKKARTILLVEDEAIIALMEKMQLEKYGYAVRIVPSGEKAVEAVGTSSDIDLILMDINLGKGIDGTEAAGIILKTRDIPIVFVSSHTEPEIVEKTEKITSYGYVVKNSSITVLDASIKMAFKLFEAKSKELEKEVALNWSEEKYRLISENTSDGIVHFSAEGLIDYVSPSYLRQLGYPELQQFGKGWDAILPEIHPDDREILFLSLHDAIEKKAGEFTYTFRVRHAKGHYIWREDHSSFLYDPSGAYLGAYVSCRDVTDRKNIESKLEILVKAIEASPAIIMITDADGTIEYVNPRFSCITGYSTEEAIGKNPRILKSGKTEENVYSDLWSTLTTGNEWKGYFRNRKKSGELYYESATIAPVKDQKGTTTNYIAIKEDLTEKRYMQESLEESNIRFNTLAGSQTVLIWESGIDKLCTYFNPTWLAFTGRTLEEESGTGWAEGVHPEDLERCLKIYTEAFDARREFSMEYRLRKANGEYGWVFDHGSPKYHEQEFIGYIGTCLDVSRTKNYEKVLQESEEKYRLLHERAGIGIGYFSLEGMVLSFNKLAAKYLGGKPEDFIGRSLHDLFPMKDAVEYATRINRAATSEYPDVYEDKVPLPAGNKHFLSTYTRISDLNGSVLGIQVISQDITQRKIAEQALQSKNEEYETINEELRSTTEELQVQNEELIQSGERLIQSERRLNQAEKVAGIGNWTLHLPTKTMIASSGADEIYGVDFIRVPLAKVQKIPLAEYRPGLDKALADLVSCNSPYDQEFKIRRANDGMIRDIHSVATYDRNTNSVFGVIQDITDQKAIENALNQSVDRIQLLLNSTAEGIYGIDLDDNCTFCNDSCLKLLGYAHESELLGRNMHSQIHGKYPDGSEYPVQECPMYQAFQNGVGVHVVDEVLWRSDGSSFPAEYWSYPQVKDGRIIGAVVSFLDITDRKLIEQALRESQERLRFALEGSNLGEWDWNFKTSTLKRNKRWAGMLGYTGDEIIDNLQQGLDLQHPEDREAAWKAVQAHLDGKTDHYSIEYRMRTKNGSYKWIHDCGKIMERDAQGKPVRLCGTHADIDEQKKARDEIKNLLAEKELLLKEVHHRIKNNMNTVSSLLSLQAEVMKEPAALRALQDAANRIKSMSRLNEQLYQSVGFSALPVNQYLSPLIDEIIANFPNGQRVKVDKDLQDFMLDAKRLQALGMIINELLTNIMKYAFSGKECGQIAVSAQSTDGQITISVQDNGIGIPESIAFGNSQGFGLELVQTLSGQLEGTVRIERKNGTRFVLEFGS